MNFRKEHKTNCEKVISCKMREPIEIEKHSTIDQEGKPLDSTWRALFTMRNLSGSI